MKKTKKHLGSIFKCYAVANIKIEGDICLLFAGEGTGSMHIFTGKNFENESVIWEGGGGTMSISAIPEKEGCFLASKGFVSMVDAKDSHIIIARYKEGKFNCEKIVDLPYLHRFDTLRGADGTNYLLAATIADYKENKEDWTHPGKLFISELPKNWNEKFKLELTVLKDGLTINHGFFKHTNNGNEVGYIGSKEGVYAVTPPEKKGGEWKIEKLINIEASDIAVIDIDSDGELEIAVISPFHGDTFEIYKRIKGEYKKVYQYQTYQNFYHVAEAGMLRGKPAFLGGARRNSMQLFAITYDDKKDGFVEQVIDEGVGPSNAVVVNKTDYDIVASANRETGQATIYYISD